MNDISDDIDGFYKALNNVCENNIPLKAVCSNGQRWLTRPIKNILEDFENASPYFCTFLANRICD